MAKRRRSIRLPHYDYTRPGAYFVTVCAHEGACMFGEIVGPDMQLSQLQNSLTSYVSMKEK